LKIIDLKYKERESDEFLQTEQQRKSAEKWRCYESECHDRRPIRIGDFWLGQRNQFAANFRRHSQRIDETDQEFEPAKLALKQVHLGAGQRK